MRESLSSKREGQNGEHAEEPWGRLLTFGDLQKYLGGDCQLILGDSFRMSRAQLMIPE